jgi:lipopolysaccharide export system ATP-binding protein
VSILETIDIVKHYKKRRVVDKVSLKVETGSVVGLLGPNGAGKTTTFYSIAGFIQPDSGTVTLDGENLTKLPIHKRARKGLSYLAQDSSVFKKLTVRENVQIVLETLGLPKKEIFDRTVQLMSDLRIMHLADNRAYSLSGGERRRVEIMRALATKPRFILLDEPFAGIDPLSIADLQKIIRELRDKGLGVLISDHNVRETLSVCDYAYIVNGGKILVDGTSQEIIQSAAARKMYLGENFTM